MHAPIKQTGDWLKSVVQGYGQYFGVPGNIKALRSFRSFVAKAWYWSLRRRSQKGTAMNWQRFTPIVAEVPEKIKPEISITYYWKISYRIIVVLIIVTTLRYF